MPDEHRRCGAHGGAAAGRGLRAHRGDGDGGCDPHQHLLRARDGRGQGLWEDWRNKKNKGKKSEADLRHRGLYGAEGGGQPHAPRTAHRLRARDGENTGAVTHCCGDRGRAFACGGRDARRQDDCGESAHCTRRQVLGVGAHHVWLQQLLYLLHRTLCART